MRKKVFYRKIYVAAPLERIRGSFLLLRAFVCVAAARGAAPGRACRCARSLNPKQASDRETGGSLRVSFVRSFVFVLVCPP